MRKKPSRLMNYEAVFEEQREGGFTVYIPALPGCISEGDIFEEAKFNIKEAITSYLESVILDGEKISTLNLPVFIG